MKKFFAWLLVCVMISGVMFGAGDVKTVKATTEVTFTFVSAGAQDGNQRYCIYLDVDGVSSLSDRYWTGNKIYIDGVEKEVNFTPSGDSRFLMIVGYSSLDENVTTAANMGVHTLSIPVGTAIGDLTVTNDVNLIVSGYSVAETKEQTIDLGESGPQDSNKRYLIRISLLEKPGASYLSNNTIYVDGEKVTISYADIGEEGSIAMVLPYEKIPNVESTTNAAAIGKHVVQIPKGSTIGNYVVKNTLTIELDGLSIMKKNYVPFSLARVQGQDSAQRYVIDLDLAGVDPSTLKDYYWNDNIIYIDGYQTSTHYLANSEHLVMYLPYENVQAGATVASEISTHFLKIAKGTVLGERSEYPIIVENDLYIQLTGPEGVQLESDPLVRNKVTVTAMNDRRNGECDMGSVYLNTTGSPDSLASSDDWQKRYAFSEGGVYYNGTLISNAKLVKILDYLYYVAVDGCGIEWKTGDVITVDGMIAAAYDDITFHKISFIRNADGSFSQYDETAPSLNETVQLDDVYVNADVDVYEIPSASLLRDGKVKVTVNGEETTNYILSEAGQYDIVRDVENVVHSAVSGPKGDITYKQTVVLFRQGDANNDKIPDIKDLLSMKKTFETNESSMSSKKAADMNGDDLYGDGLDRALLRRYILGELTSREIYDASEPEVVVGVISDMHYDTRYDAQRRVNTIKALNYYKSHNAKVIFFNGDVSDLGTVRSYEKLVEDILAVYPNEETRPKMIMTGDNHEWHEAWQNVNGYTGSLTYKESQEIFTNGLAAVRNSVILDEGEGTNSYTLVNGYHFIGISSDGMSGASATYDSETVVWLTEHLDAAVEADATKPIFVGIHQPPKDTVSMSDSEYSDQLNEILKQYPQAVVFTSHTHQTIADERSFWRDDSYAAVNTGTLFYGTGLGYDSALTVHQSQQFAQGLLVRVNGSRVDIERCDFWNNTKIANNWIFDIME